MFNTGRFVNVLDDNGRVHSAFVFSEMAETEGTELIVPLVNSQTNEVTWQHSSHARNGKDFVELGEDVQVLRDFNSKKPFAQPEESNVDENGNPIVNPHSDSVFNTRHHHLNKTDTTK